jgi:YVTN family beta-propeller protein
MRPMQAAVCVLVLATCVACGSGSSGPKADAAPAAEAFPLPAGGLPTATPDPGAFVPAYAVKGSVSVKVGKYPSAVAVNPKTNRIYIANNRSKNVTVIDGATNKTTTVAVQNEPVAIAVNQVTNKVYVLNQKGNGKLDSVNPDGTGTVTVIDGATNKPTKTVTVNSEPGALAVNEQTNKIYVANAGSNDVTVIDGKTNKGINVELRKDGATPDIVLAPQDVRVNPVTDKIYITGSQNNTVAVMDGKTNAFIFMLTEGGTQQNPSGLTPTGMALNTTTNKIYTANLTSNDVTVMDGATNALTPVPLVDVQDPYTVAVNPVTNKIYVANLTSKSITVIDGVTNQSVTIGDLPGKPHDVVVNPVTNKIYFPLFITYRGSAVGDDKQITGLIGELDGATNALTFVIAGITPYAIAVNPATNKVYVVNQDGNTVTVLTASGGKAQ